MGPDDAGTWSVLVARAYVDSGFFPADGSRSQYGALEDPGTFSLQSLGYDPNQVMPDCMLTPAEYQSILSLGVTQPTEERFQPLLWNNGADSGRTWTWEYDSWIASTASSWALLRGDDPAAPDPEMLSVDYMFRSAVLEQLGNANGYAFLGSTELKQDAVANNLRLLVQVVTLADTTVCAAEANTSLGGITGWASALPGSSNVLTFSFGATPVAQEGSTGNSVVKMKQPVWASGPPGGDGVFSYAFVGSPTGTNRISLDPGGPTIGYESGAYVESEVVGLLGDSNEVLLEANGLSFGTARLTAGFDLRHARWQLPDSLPPQSIVKVVGYMGPFGNTYFSPSLQETYLVGW